MAAETGPIPGIDLRSRAIAAEVSCGVGIKEQVEQEVVDGDARVDLLAAVGLVVLRSYDRLGRAVERQLEKLLQDRLAARQHVGRRL